MTPHRHRGLTHSEAGGITIVVALMLLVLLTIAAVAMSRNALRELVTSGLSRQGAMARNAADAGLEWSIYWMDLENGQAAGGNTAATQLTSLKAGLLADPTLAGRAKDLNSTDFAAPNDYTPGGNLQAALTLPSTPSGVQAGYTLGLTYMGKLPVANMSQGVGSSAFAPATGGPLKLAPDLWAIRSDAQVIQGGVTFIHARELWLSTPVQFN